MNHDWRDHGVKIIPSAGLDLNTPQTPGMTRAAAVNRAMAGANKALGRRCEHSSHAKTGAAPSRRTGKHHLRCQRQSAHALGRAT